MPLQSDNLVLVGLGIISDRPPISLQPSLAKGIHLRFGFARERGFPWYGYYIFRRVHRETKPLCLGAQFKPEWKVGLWPDTQAIFAQGEFESDVNLTFADQFPPSGRSEFDLRERKFLRFTLPTAQTAREFQVKIGLLKDPTEPPPPRKICVEFKALKPGLVSNPYVSDKVEFTSEGGKTPSSTIPLQARANIVGLLCDPQLTIKLPTVATSVDIDLSYTGRPATVAVLDPKGQIVGQRDLSSKPGALETVTFSGQQILSIVIKSPAGHTLLHGICYSAAATIEQAPVRSIKLTGFHQAVPVAQAQTSGAAGDIVTAILAADVMTAVEIEGGPAVLIDICIVPVSQDLGVGWEQLRQLQYPLCLPTDHADYPCPGKPATPEQAQSLALARIQYGDPARWSGENFATLTGVLENLVMNGPPPSGLPMADRRQAYASSEPGVPPTPDAPSMPKQYPLDLLLLGSLHPSVAMMLGLYYVDSSAEQDVAYDYIVIADHSGRFHGNPAEALAALKAPLPGDVDAWVAYNLKRENPPALAPPSMVQAYALPNGVVANSDANAPIPAGINAAGVRWLIDAAPDGKLLPGAPIGYHLWRADIGPNQPAAAPPPSDYAHLTTAGMIMVANAALPSGSTPQNASDWPPFRLFSYDRGLADGWYSYRVSAVDIFGRHSTLSTPSAWLQWAWPAPVPPTLPPPKPWYYVDPPVERQINPFAVRLLGKTPPPRPPGVEATALDPDDQMLLRDGTYNDWWSLAKPNWWDRSDTDQANVLPLRVRWRWTAAQMLQAPDTTEFRIYFNPGTDFNPDVQPPANDAGESTNWQDRIYVVGYDEHFKVTDDQGHPLIDDEGRPVRQYDVLLPVIGESPFAGVPLAPSEDNPIVYAHIGVSAADDKAHTADNPKWATGNWGGRTGNESRVGTPAKIYRVLRAKPPAPGVVDLSDKVWATPADYHSRSYYTFRWTDAANMQVHVFRALDDTLFQVDWQRRKQGPPQTDPPAPADFPIASWDQATRDAVAAELNGLNAVAGRAAFGDDARTAYDALSNNALRTLAGLPGNEAAFSRITYSPLTSDDPANADRAGPDGDDTYAPSAALRAYTAELPGRAHNRYFFRAAYVNGVHTFGPLGPSSPPVYLRKVEPPRTPVVTNILGGERQITLIWTANREADLSEYRVYRTDDERKARDVRLMDLVGTVAETQADLTLRAKDVTFTDTEMVALSFHYRLVAVDNNGNMSPPSLPVQGMAYDYGPPAEPTWERAEWVKLDAAGVEHAYADAAHNLLPAVALTFTTPQGNVAALVQRQNNTWRNVSAWQRLPVHDVAANIWRFTFYDRTAQQDATQRYRGRLITFAGVVLDSVNEREVAVPN